MWRNMALAFLVLLSLVVITIRDLARNASDAPFSDGPVGIFSAANFADYYHDFPLRVALLILMVFAWLASCIYRRIRFRNLLRARKERKSSQ